MSNLTPSLDLIEGAKISGNVVYISTSGSVWFCPQSIQESMDKMMEHVDLLNAAGKLSNVKSQDLSYNMLCIARSADDGELYRASIIEAADNCLNVKVQFIDFGNIEDIGINDVFEFPDGLLQSPCAVEVFLETLPLRDFKSILETKLMKEVYMLDIISFLNLNIS